MLTATGVVEIPMVMAMALVLGFVNAVDMPLRQALAPDLVPRNLLSNAIALNSMAFNAARVVGPALAGVIIAVGTGVTGSAMAGVAVNLGINTVTYVGVLIGLLRMNPREIRRVERPERAPAGAREPARGDRASRCARPLVLWPLVLLGGIAAFGFNFQILLPLFATGILELGADGYGALFAAMGIGSLAGSLTLAYMHRRRAMPIMLLGGAAFVVLLVGIAASRSMWLAAPLIIGAGYASMLMINTINATVQANVTDALRGRVMALYVTVFAGSAPLGGLFAGAVAEAWGTPAAFVTGRRPVGGHARARGARPARARGARGSLGVTIIDSAAEPATASGGAGRPGDRRARRQRRAECVAAGGPGAARGRRPRSARRSSGIGSSSSRAASSRSRRMARARRRPVGVSSSTTARLSFGSVPRSTRPASARVDASRVTTGAVTRRRRATSRLRLRAHRCRSARSTLYCW